MFSMTNEAKTKFSLLKKIAFIAYCFFICGALIAFSIVGYEIGRVNLGILFILTAVFHYLEFEKHLKNPAARYIYAGLTFVGVILGFLCISLEGFELKTICLIFGIMDLSSGAIEIFTNALILDKTVKNPIFLVEYLISTADIVFGILLIIEREQGLLVHVLYLSAVFLVNGILALVELLLHKHHHE